MRDFLTNLKYKFARLFLFYTYFYSQILKTAPQKLMIRILNIWVSRKRAMPKRISNFEISRISESSFSWNISNFYNCENVLRREFHCFSSLFLLFLLLLFFFFKFSFLKYLNSLSSLLFHIWRKIDFVLLLL